MMRYIGGKNKIANWIISHFPQNYKDLVYIEVFGGGGWVLFKKEPSKLEIYNDINGDLVNLWIQIRDNYDEFYRRAKWIFNLSREMYYTAKKKIFETREFKDEIDRAIQYAILLSMSFSSDIMGGMTSQQTKFKSAFLSFFNRLEAINKRLKKVIIENLDYKKLINKYNKYNNKLFYFDPPYYKGGKNKYYNLLWTETEHIELYNTIKNINNYWIVSYYDDDFIIDLYKDYNIFKKDVSVVSQKRTIEDNRKKSRKTEIIITNIPTEIMLKNIK